MYLRKVEAIKSPGKNNEVWNRFWWVEVINGKTYQMEHEMNVDSITMCDNYVLQHIQNLFNEEKLKNEA